MKRTFIRTQYFEKKWKSLGLTDQELLSLEGTLLQNPEVGDLIPNSGGVRKMRFALKGKGTRGGARVLYVDFCTLSRTYLLDVYSKNQQVNLTPDQLKQLRELIKSGGLL